MALPDTGTSAAVLVGVAAYTRLDPLPAVTAGVTRMAELLRDRQVWGLPTEHVTLLGSNASRDTILGAVRDAASGCTDTLLVYFAGHGLRDRSDELHLALADADDDHPEIASLAYPELRRVVGRAGYRARRRITVLDCCYSGLAGGMGAATLARPDLAHLLEEDGDDESEGGDYGSCVLTSAPKTGRSFAPPGARYPEFTGELIEVLEHGIPDAGPTLSVDQIWRRVRRRLLTQGSPEPQQFGHNAVARQGWVHNRAHRRAPSSKEPFEVPTGTLPAPPEPPLRSDAVLGTASGMTGQSLQTEPSPPAPPTPQPSALPESARPAVRGITRRRAIMLGTAVAAVAGGIAEAVNLMSGTHSDPDKWRLRWRFDAANQLSAAPTVADGVVYVGSGDHNLYAIDAATGAKKWAYETGDQINSSPAVLDGVVYFGSNDRNVYAVHADTGRKKWSYTTGKAVAASPAVVGGTVYIGGWDNHMYALDAATGAEKWSFPTGAYVDGVRPVVVGGLVYFGSLDKSFYALDAATGKKKWAYEIGASSSSPTAVGGTVYVGGGDDSVFALDAATGAKKWAYSGDAEATTNRDSEITSSPVLADGVLYMGSWDHNVYALDAATGTKKWAYETGDEVWGGPAVAGGVVYIGSFDHRLYALDAATGTKKWSYETDFQIPSSPVVRNNTVFVCSDGQYVYALDTSAEKPST
ncbi:PQQ-binding-like beta-propeller repeat protein [Streptomyces sp. NPDC086033]|uniref:caspase, EACC1-associated type n=1 Tax=Streptomyces sp. NPDC086033 TaxID=3365747 RepID=UPI0037D8F83E